MTSPDLPAVRQLPPPEQRGQTTIADRVVARLAAQAAAEVEQAGGTAPRLMGVTRGRAGTGTPRASARVDGRLATIGIRLSLTYPAPVRALTREVRRHIAERVTALTDLQVRQVDIEVTHLLHGQRRRTR